jgi:hypothetical protein
MGAFDMVVWLGKLLVCIKAALVAELEFDITNIYPLISKTHIVTIHGMLLLLCSKRVMSLFHVGFSLRRHKMALLKVYVFLLPFLPKLRIPDAYFMRRSRCSESKIFRRMIHVLCDAAPSIQKNSHTLF